MEQVQLSRKCKAVQVPAGNETTLAEGLEVTIMQTLGGTFTVQVPALGGLFRIAGDDADALGKEVPEQAKIDSPDDADLEAKVWAALRTCFDPEIPVNIVDLGLIYTVDVQEVEEKSNISIEMTMTSPACPAAPQLLAQSKDALARLEGAGEVEIKLVMTPPWTPDRMTEDARDQLGIF